MQIMYPEVCCLFTCRVRVALTKHTRTRKLCLVALYQLCMPTEPCKQCDSQASHHDWGMHAAAQVWTGREAEPNAGAHLAGERLRAPQQCQLLCRSRAHLPQEHVAEYLGFV